MYIKKYYNRETQFLPHKYHKKNYFKKIMCEEECAKLPIENENTNFEDSNSH
jgi:hypothetical protein